MADELDGARRLAFEMAMATFPSGNTNFPLKLAKRFAFFERVIRSNNNKPVDSSSEASAEIDKLAELFSVE